MKSNVATMRAELHKRFPLAFSDFCGDKHPLKIAIHLDIIAAWPEVDRKTLYHALSDYTGGARYLGACKVGAHRIGLDGTVCGSISARDARHAVRLYEMERNRRRLLDELKVARADVKAAHGLLDELRDAKATIADLQRQLMAA